MNYFLRLKRARKRLDNFIYKKNTKIDKKISDKYFDRLKT